MADTARQDHEPIKERRIPPPGSLEDSAEVVVGEPPPDVGGPHQDVLGGWHDLDEPSAVLGPHEDPDEPGHWYDLDEPVSSDLEEELDDERRDDE